MQPVPRKVSDVTHDPYVFFFFNPQRKHISITHVNCKRPFVLLNCWGEKVDLADDGVEGCGVNWVSVKCGVGWGCFPGWRLWSIPSVRTQAGRRGYLRREEGGENLAAPELQSERGGT